MGEIELQSIYLLSVSGKSIYSPKCNVHYTLRDYVSNSSDNNKSEGSTVPI
jgi:hypothetical protein